MVGAPPRPRYGSLQRSPQTSLLMWRIPDISRRNSLAHFRQLAHCREPSTCYGRMALSNACPDLTLPAVDVRNLVRKWATVMRPPATSTVVTCFILWFGERDIIAVIQHRAVVYMYMHITPFSFTCIIDSWWSTKIWGPVSVFPFLLHSVFWNCCFSAENCIRPTRPH